MNPTLGRHRRLSILLPVGLLLGFLVAQQFLSVKETTAIRDSKDNALFALEVSALIDSNQKLRSEISQLQERKDGLEAARSDRSKTQEELGKEGSILTIVDGNSKVKGQGVTLTIADQLQTEQLVDILNAIRNVGAEAFALNLHRINAYTSIRNLNVTPPYTFEIIGDPDILSNALTRPGGILSQIRVKGNVTKGEVHLVAVSN